MSDLKPNKPPFTAMRESIRVRAAAEKKNSGRIVLSGVVPVPEAVNDCNDFDCYPAALINDLNRMRSAVRHSVAP